MKPGRNEACPCGSGRKYKRCCGQAAAQPAGAVSLKTQGDALAERSQFEQALLCYRQALLLQPSFAEVHNNLGNALVRLGRLEEALTSYRQVLRLRPGIAQTHSNLCRVLLDLKRYDEAIADGRRAVALNPMLADAHANLGDALLDSDRIGEAIDSYTRALAIDGNFVEVHNCLGNAERSRGDFDRALAHYHRALELKPDYAETHNNLGVTLRLLGHTARAEASSQRALELDPSLMAALAALGEMAADRGEFDRAEQLLRRVVAQAPGNVEAWISLGRLRKMTAADTDWLHAVKQLFERPLRPRERISLHYALGKYFDDIGEVRQAFASFQLANEITRGHTPRHDREQLHGDIDRLIGAFARDPLRTLAGKGLATQRPIFIIGMPRSGTSLAEQILASHPRVFGAGELTYWHRAASVTEPDELRVLAQSYLQLLTGLDAEADRVVDKMPTNFMSLGAIHAAMPSARIIHMQRHPIDTCLSIYFQDFDSNFSYANDLSDLANFYAEYSRLMQHWREVLPAGVMLEVPYERLVAEPERWSRRMIEFIGVEWDARCLQSHTTARSVVTASKWQVRQAINRAGVERWRRYSDLIGPLLELQ